MPRYKVLDLRTGEYFKQADIFWDTKNWEYYSRRDAEMAITVAINLSRTKLIKEYFEVIVIEDV